jgi:hypothetical protein
MIAFARLVPRIGKCSERRSGKPDGEANDVQDGQSRLIDDLTRWCVPGDWGQAERLSDTGPFCFPHASYTEGSPASSEESATERDQRQPVICPQFAAHGPGPHPRQPRAGHLLEIAPGTRTVQRVVLPAAGSVLHRPRLRWRVGCLVETVTTAAIGGIPGGQVAPRIGTHPGGPGVRLLAADLVHKRIDGTHVISAETRGELHGLDQWQDSPASIQLLGNEGLKLIHLAGIVTPYTQQEPHVPDIPAVHRQLPHFPITGQCGTNRSCLAVGSLA